MEFNLELPINGLEVEKAPNLVVHTACYELCTVWCFKTFSRNFFMLNGFNRLINLVSYREKNESRKKE